MENAIQLAQTPGLILCSYGDTLRVPASNGMSLLKGQGARRGWRMVYSSADALKIAQRQSRQRQVVFFAIGFETTTPPTAVAIRQAQALELKNFSVFCNHVLTPVGDLAHPANRRKYASSARCRWTVSSARRMSRR